MNRSSPDYLKLAASNEISFVNGQARPIGTELLQQTYFLYSQITIKNYST